MSRVLFLVKRRNTTYTPPFGLLYSASFVADMLTRNGHWAQVVQVTDGNDVDREVVKYNPTHVVIEALWVTPAKLKELMGLPRHEGRRWIVRLHSKPSFLALEGMAMEWLRSMIALKPTFPLSIAANNPIATKEFAQVFSTGISYLPNYYGLMPEVPRIQPNDSIRIGCFGALRPLKNTLEQAFGAIIFADRRRQNLEFVINSNRIEQHAEPVLKNLRGLFNEHPHHKLVELPWMDHRAFLGQISTMDMGLQVSFSESFNIVAADFAASGIPIVVSDEIFWMPDRFKALTTDARDIADRLQAVDRMPDFINKCQMRWALRKYNVDSEFQWLNFVKRR